MTFLQTPESGRDLDHLKVTGLDTKVVFCFFYRQSLIHTLSNFPHSFPPKTASAADFPFEAKGEGGLRRACVINLGSLTPGAPSPVSDTWKITKTLVIFAGLREMGIPFILVSSGTCGSGRPAFFNQEQVLGSAPQRLISSMEVS